MNNNSTCKNCTASNFRQIGELSYDEWLLKAKKHGWTRYGNIWQHDPSLKIMSENDMMEFFRVGDTPYPPAWDEIKGGSNESTM